MVGEVRAVQERARRAVLSGNAHGYSLGIPMGIFEIAPCDGVRIHSGRRLVRVVRRVAFVSELVWRFCAFSDFGHRWPGLAGKRTKPPHQFRNKRNTSHNADQSSSRSEFDQEMGIRGETHVDPRSPHEYPCALPLKGWTVRHLRKGLRDPPPSMPPDHKRTAASEFDGGRPGRFFDAGTRKGDALDDNGRGMA